MEGHKVLFLTYILTVGCSGLIIADLGGKTSIPTWAWEVVLLLVWKSFIGNAKSLWEMVQSVWRYIRGGLLYRLFKRWRANSEKPPFRATIFGSWGNWRRGKLCSNFSIVKPFFRTDISHLDIVVSEGLAKVEPFSCCTIADVNCVGDRTWCSEGSEAQLLP